MQQYSYISIHVKPFLSLFSIVPNNKMLQTQVNVHVMISTHQSSDCVELYLGPCGLWWSKQCFKSCNYQIDEENKLKSVQLLNGSFVVFAFYTLVQNDKTLSKLSIETPLHIHSHRKLEGEISDLCKTCTTIHVSLKKKLQIETKMKLLIFNQFLMEF